MKIKVSAFAKAILEMAETDDLNSFLEECGSSRKFVTMNKDLIRLAKKSVKTSKAKAKIPSSATTAAFAPPTDVPIVDDDTCEAD